MPAPEPHPINASTSAANPGWFFALTLAWSWVCFGLAAWQSQNGSQSLVPVLHGLGGLSPLAVAVTLITIQRADIKPFLQRIYTYDTISARWLAVIFLLVPLVSGAAALVDILGGGWGLRLEQAARLLAEPGTILPYLLFILVFGPLPEEPGWRGYALDGLMARVNALQSSLVVGGVWALWHLPLFFVVGSYQNQLGFGSLGFWLYVGLLPLTAILYTWIFVNTSRSILAAILFHFMQNLTGELFELSPRADLIAFGLWAALAAGIVAIFGPKSLTRRSSTGEK